ncbi:MAG TPA: N-acetylmuramic acid 6-phosphate etherase [Candidatus Faecousia excrementipullorum]|nr:N-acetylmuramic acid 6-phosphate etherase [Candidatus Faecousia excrementipullorum]
MSLNLANMSTETRNPNTMLLDTMTPLEIVTAMNQEDARIAQVIQPELSHVAQCVVWGIASIQSGGRIIYMGAGTSGRLGVLDAVECPPTFGVDPSLVVGLIAGGEKAFVRAVEGAEDDPALGRLDLQKIHLAKEDLVIGIAASGRTPYVLGGLEYATEVGCHTVAISCNPGSIIGKYAQLAIEVVPGPEVLTGSTRLKAGTCQKLILNMISTATMVGCGKAYQNLMVDVVQTNEKLVTRAQNIVMESTGVNRETAKKVIQEAGGSCKKAIVMILANCDAEAAGKRLDKAKGHVREAIRE